MKKITIGIVANVDAGKTTLSEALLYKSGTRRSFGRVDKGESLLDNNEIERRRGITIYAKPTKVAWGDTEINIIDTPGHADFSAEMERALQVMDMAVLLISAVDGVTGQTRLLWKLLKEYEIPTIIFINKLDQEGADYLRVVAGIRRELSDMAVDFTGFAGENAGSTAGKETTGKANSGPSDRTAAAEFYDRVAMCDEDAMEEFIEKEKISHDTLRNLIDQRRLFPCLGGAALRLSGVEELLDVLDSLSVEPEYYENFGARCFKILRDGAARLTMIKITGGVLKVRDEMEDSPAEVTGLNGIATGTSKVNQIRVYSGEKFQNVGSASAGDIVAIEGLTYSFSGQGFGAEESAAPALLIPVLSYQAHVDMDAVKALPIFRQIEEEIPEISVDWDEEKKTIAVKVMGPVQLEILTNILKSRFGLNARFDTGEVLYKETIAMPVIGVGHFEPLRHYAEVHLKLEPLPMGTGLIFDSDLSTDQLAKNWQRLILTHLAERTHRGVLTGSPITDMKITIVAGRASNKHTEGGDFRQATYRALRQGLAQTETILLEPYYHFELTLPQACVGRAMTDLSNMHADLAPVEQVGGTQESEAGSAPGVTKENGAGGAPGIGTTWNSESIFMRLTGRVPVAALKDYAKEVAAYTKGEGALNLYPDEYGPCHNSKEVVEARGYDFTADLRNTPDSVFCANGAGFNVPWDQVFDYMHLELDESYSAQMRKAGSVLDYPDGKLQEDLRSGNGNDTRKESHDSSQKKEREAYLGTEEIDSIISSISRRGQVKSTGWRRRAGRRRSVGDLSNGRTGSNSNTDGSRRGGRFGIKDGLSLSDIRGRRTDSRLDTIAKYGNVIGNSNARNIRSETETPKIFALESADYLLVDGYNVIFACDELKELAQVNLDAARTSLEEKLSNFKALHDFEVIIVYDAYRVAGHRTEILNYQNLHLVFTAEAETADHYIEKFATEKGRKWKVAVATSDGVEQVIIRSAGCVLVSSRELIARFG